MKNLQRVTGLHVMLVLVSCAGAALAEVPSPLNVREKLDKALETDWIARDAAYTAAQPTAASTTGSVTTAQDAAGGCDGIKNGRWGFHTASGETDPWWQVDLGQPYLLDRLVVFNRTDRGTAPALRISKFWWMMAPRRTNRNGEPPIGTTASRSSVSRKASPWLLT